MFNYMFECFTEHELVSQKHADASPWKDEKTSERLVEAIRWASVLVWVLAARSDVCVQAVLPLVQRVLRF